MRTEREGVATARIFNLMAVAAPNIRGTRQLVNRLQIQLNVVL
jgi:hypothetical protein